MGEKSYMMKTEEVTENNQEIEDIFLEEIENEDAEEKDYIEFGDNFFEEEN